MKPCSKCKTIKGLSSFHKQTRNKDGLQFVCKECRKVMDKNRYLKNPLYFKECLKRIERRNLAYICSQLAKSQCVDCGENDMAVLDFDHVKEKKYDVSRMREHSIENIQKEIEKCVIRCANCHRKRTAKENGWRRLAFIQQIA